MIDKFLDYIAVEKQYSPKTVQAYGDDLRDFCSFLNGETGNFDPTAVSEDDVRLWLVDMMDNRHQSPRSVRRRLSSLHSFYRFLLRIGAVRKDITRLVVAPKVDKPLPVFFKPSEMERATMFDDSADDFVSIRDSLIIQLLYQTGMRQAELLGLKDADIDLDAAQIRIFGKRRKERIVPIGDALKQQIKRYLEARNQLSDSGMFFVHTHRDGTVARLTKSVLYQIVTARMGEVSTLKKHSPHVLRHTFATTMLNNGADIRTIQQLLGHAGLAATQIYTHTTFDQIQRTYKAAHPRAKNK